MRGDAHVPHLGVPFAVQEAPAGNRAAADAGADGQVDEVACAARRAGELLPERRGVHVGVDRDRCAGAGAREGAKVGAAPRRLGRAQEHSAPKVERAERADPQRGERGSAGGGEDRRDRGVDRRGGVAGRKGPRRDRTRSSAASPHVVLVPPSSIPPKTRTPRTLRSARRGALPRRAAPADFGAPPRISHWRC